MVLQYVDHFITKFNADMELPPPSWASLVLANISYHYFYPFQKITKQTWGKLCTKRLQHMCKKKRGTTRQYSFLIN